VKSVIAGYLPSGSSGCQRIERASTSSRSASRLASPHRLAMLRDSRNLAILPKPMPCSPVQVPPMRSRDGRTMRSFRRLGRGSLFRVVRVEDDAEVEIAVADMADEGRATQTPRLDVGLGFQDAIGEREIGTQTSVGQPLAPGATPSRHRRRHGAPATSCCVPRPGVQAKSLTAVIGGDLLTISACSATPGLGAVELEEQQGAPAARASNTC
jgi:hypothetical protein